MTRSFPRTLIVASIVLWTMVQLDVLSEPASLKLGTVSTGTMTYPALDNVDFREGTLEFWLKLAFDPAPYLPAKDYQGLLVIASMEGETGGLNVHYCAQAGANVPLLWCSIGPKTKLTPFGAAPPVFKKDEWHHVALTWKGCDMAMFLDGKKASERKHNDFIYRVFGATGSKLILWGDRWNVTSLMVIDDFRLSRVLRSPEELGFHGELKRDPFTSILDPFEDSFVPDGKTPTRPRVVFNGEGGLASPQCRFVEGKFGKGLAFFAEK